MTSPSGVSGREELDILDLLETAVGQDGDKILTDYLEQVANTHLITLKEGRFLQHGKKGGQSLYTHILDGIFLLNQLRELLQLSELETRLLFTAYTIHDINKLLPQSAGLSRDATPEQITSQINHFTLNKFFPEVQTYLWDIITLVRGHPGHTSVSGEALNRRNTIRYGLGIDRVIKLREIIRALDAVDLAHSISEHNHHQTFLSHLNRFALTLGTQYDLFVHRLDESRGALTNIFHNAISDYLSERFNAIPLLLYPDGIVYAIMRGTTPTIEEGDFRLIATRTAGELARMTGVKFEQFIEVRPLGIKVDAKCLTLGRPFDDLWSTIHNLVERRSFKVDELTQKAAQRTQVTFAKYAALYPDAVPSVEQILSDKTIAQTTDRLRLGELIRSYVIFLSDHFANLGFEPWTHVFDLLDISPEQRQILTFFDARLDRAYVLARDLRLSMSEVYKRLLDDGRDLLSRCVSDDPRTDLFTNYLQRHTLFGTQTRTPSPADNLHQYVTNQHHQCVQCSEPFPTSPWMSADVRSDIAVQTFSNRLRGGPGEPKKNVCGICQAQYLTERLSYPEIRGEHTVYLHLFPYAYLTTPFVQGLRRVIRRIGEETDVRALWLDGDRAMDRYIREQQLRAPMLTRTRQNKPHSYGLYIPIHAETLIGNLLIFPLNPAGKTDTERFLFALEYALILQRYFGCRVVLSTSAVTPFEPNVASDLATDMTPLSCRGLIDSNVYRQFKPDGSKPDNLPVLWNQMKYLYSVKRAVVTGQSDPLPELVQALADHPLAIFHVVEKLIEARVRNDHKVGNSVWMLNRITAMLVEPVQGLAYTKGGTFVEQLSTYLERLAQLAWDHHLRGATREKHSLMMPLDHVFEKLGRRGKEHDVAFLKAATVEDIHQYLNRVAEARYRTQAARPKRYDYINTFVGIFFDQILGEVYGGSTTRLLNDEKLLRSAFLFYLRVRIPSKLADQPEDSDTDLAETTIA